jgi:hypothetical protein
LEEAKLDITKMTEQMKQFGLHLSQVVVRVYQLQSITWDIKQYFVLLPIPFYSILKFMTLKIFLIFRRI